MTVEELARWIRQSLRRNGALEIDGLGTFEQAHGSGSISFRGARRPSIFVAYAHEDAVAAGRLYREFVKRGFSAWLDRRKLLPGQNWPRRIEDAINGADFFVACFSAHSVNKRGGFQAEIRYALDCAKRVPLDDVFLIPIRLDDCRVPARIQRETQYIDLFPDWRSGFENVIQVIERQMQRAA